MKKLFIACAVVIAATLASCGDTNYCYELTATYTLAGISQSATTPVWGTSNDLDAAIAKTKDMYIKMGVPEDAIKFDYKKTNKSQSDCLPKL